VAFLWPLATLYSFEYMKHEERKDTFFAFYVMTYGITMGIAFAGNLTTLYLFYEMLTLVTFPLVLFPLSKEAVRASRTYLYFSIGGAGLAFIGLGINPPMTSLGQLSSDGANMYRTYFYQFAIPALVISLIIFAFYMLGNCLRDALDPRMKS